VPYTTPTYEEFITRFPIFEDKEKPTVEALLAEAATQIDNSWVETDYQSAIMYLTAHLLATDNSGEGEEVEIGGANNGVIASESFGPMSVGYATGGASGSLSSSDQYGSTVYGRRFLALLRKNKPAIVAV
jgi:hypothetical protein